MLLGALRMLHCGTVLREIHEVICRCCGMPLDEGSLSREQDGVVNQEYCRWCYADGHFTLDFWEKYAALGGMEKYEECRQQIMEEFNDLHIEGLPVVRELHVLTGSYINLEYRLPGGQNVRFLDDRASYLGNQLACTFGGDRCFGIVASMAFLLVCTYEKDGGNPELVLYKRR